jgi:peptide-methionine (S)-S-oxide reductase
MSSERTEETAILGGGCFWCIEAVFRRLDGVSEVVSGYAGGHVPSPSYEQVCGKKTGHAEVVRIRFDPAKLSFETLLDVFFTAHDPTTLNRQGNDVGPQYRSVVYCQDDAQRDALQAAIARIDASGDHADRVVTEVAGPATFYPAEDYHQDYFRLHSHEPYCSYVVAPKVAKCIKRFGHLMRPE